MLLKRMAVAGNRYGLKSRAMLLNVQFIVPLTNWTLNNVLWNRYDDNFVWVRFWIRVGEYISVI